MQTYDNPFTTPGRWYRGNLHTHTSESDGRFTPQQAVDWYRGQGYDFVALTDHNHCTSIDGLSSAGLLVLPGIEVHPGRTSLGESFHIVAAGVGQARRFSKEDGVQAAIDELRAAGGVVWLGHPYWSGLLLPEMIDLGGVIGIEVYNATCAHAGKAFSGVHWDDLLAHGRLPLGLAVDDAHWGRGDYGLGWIMVKASELTSEAILQALSAGRFYATQGPEIHDVQLGEQEIRVRCSPCALVNCISLNGMGERAIAPGPDQLLSEVTLPRRHQKGYLRIECIDAQGRTAWAQPAQI